MSDIEMIIDDYIAKMDGLNKKRVTLAEKEVQLAMHELRAYNDLRQKLHEMRTGGINGVSKDK